ncbi:MAG TPA: flagellar basal body P-ring formation chaperone FlgA [Xanthobacteraceae bacterium]|nr:flagellar basal body P-ring formation chaperone FlgA [Xanthobacteraceae bacterium]
MHFVRTLPAALTVLALLGGSAAAEQAAMPSLKSEITVDSDFVRLGDLIENAGMNATASVFRAPELGLSGTIQVYRVIEAARGKGLSLFDTHGLSEVVVLRASRTIALPELERAVADTAARQYGFGEAKDIAVNFDAYVRVLAIEPGATSAPRLTQFSFDPRTQRFEANVDVPGSATLRSKPVRISGALYETAEVVTLARALGRGEAIRDNDIAIERRPKVEVPDAIRRADAVIGQAARRDLRPGQFLHLADLMKPELVGRGDPVTLVFQSPGVKLTVQAKALEAGTQGDMVQVLNPQSKRIVQAMVDGPGHVVIARAPAVPAADPEATGSVK